MTYSGIIYGLLTRLRQRRTMDIKLPLSIINAKTMPNFSALHKLHHKKLLHQRIAFSGKHFY